ncbi:hypothetical protein N9595_04025 [Bacteroidia bacterium]|nr:hypothetical protein [Bacteroidia bacterium]
MNIKNIILILIAGFAITSCQDEYEAGTVPGHEVAGEWYVVTYIGGTPVVGHELISTYNTAAADGKEMWLDDLGHIWPVKAKIGMSPENNSFSGTGDNIEAPIYSYDTLDIIRDETIDPIDSIQENFEGYETVTVTEGKVIQDAGRSKTGVITDSVYFKGEFSDDPGSVYEFAGHRRTGFGEDDY